MAAASHLPFLLSVALVGCTSKSVSWGDIAQLASTGYKDVSRLASGDVVMHRDICVSNPEPIVAWIDSFIRELYEVRKLLEDENGPRVMTFARFSSKRPMPGPCGWPEGFLPRPDPYSTRPEIPSFTDGIGQTLMGSWMWGQRKRIFGDSKTRKEK